MGSPISKPLNDLCKEEIADAVANLGEAYESYCEGFIGNGLDGRVLVSLDETEIQETLDDLEISNRLHRRVLVKEHEKAKQTAESSSTYYDYSPAKTVNDLGPICQVTDTIFRENQGTTYMAGVHLVLDNGNQLALDTKLFKGGQVVTQPLNLAKGHNICGNLVQDGTDQQYYKIEVPKNIQQNLYEDPTPTMTYTGHILKDESGKRIGMVCMIEKCDPSGVEDVNRENFLRRMAIETEYQLNLRRQLVKRWHTLTTQMGEHKAGNLLSGYMSDLLNGGMERRTSHALPIFQDMASEGQKAHLPLNFYDLVDEFSAPRPPIAKNDMERCAVVESLGLFGISSKNEITLQLHKLVKMATETFGFSRGELNILNHESQICVASFDNSNYAIGGLCELQRSFQGNLDGAQLMQRTPRGPSISNYPIAWGQTFVVQDLRNDETFQWMSEISPIGCYVGAPIIDLSGRAIAVLCLLDSNPRSDFGEANERQIENIARSISLIVEHWFVKESVNRRVKELGLIDQRWDKDGIPKGRVTMVLTDIQGSTALLESNSVSLWESNSIPMQDSHELHNDIIRGLCAKHMGYEIETEGDSFALAFHDPVDAFAFALKAQKALFDAKWPVSLLSQPEAKEEAGTFRGLRVRMAIHHGNAGLSEDLVSERVNYKGETMNIAKSLVSMAHGGQILTTSETWEIASTFIGSIVDMP